MIQAHVLNQFVVILKIWDVQVVRLMVMVLPEDVEVKDIVALVVAIK